MRVTLVLPLPSESVGCFCKTMIKSKIEARERALELAIPLVIALINGGHTVNMVSIANEMVEYLIGDVDLPEVVELKKEE